jgi:hypothetical protein
MPTAQVLTATLLSVLGLSLNTLHAQTCELSDPQYMGRTVCVAAASDGSVFFGGRGAPGFEIDGVLIDGENGYVARKAPDGSLIWVVKIDALEAVNIGAIAVDELGGVFVAGISYSASISFGDSLINSPGDAFVAKFGMNGDLHRVTRALIHSGESPTLLRVDNAGGAYLGGLVTADGDTAVFGSIGLPTWEVIEGFVAHADENGDWTWAQLLKPQEEILLHALVTDTTGRLVVVGSFVGHYMHIGEDTVAVNTEQWVEDTYSLFVAKFGATGQLEWVRSTDAQVPGSSNGRDVVASIGQPLKVFGGLTEGQTLDGQVASATGAAIIFMDYNGQCVHIQALPGSGAVHRARPLPSGEYLVCGAAFIGSIGTTTMDPGDAWQCGFVGVCDDYGNWIAVDQTHGNGDYHFLTDIQLVDGSTQAICAGVFEEQIWEGGDTLPATAGGGMVYDVDLLALAMMDRDAAINLAAWPNPATTEVHVRARGTLSTAPVVLLDDLGREVSIVNAKGREVVLSMRNLGPGGYTIRWGAAFARVIKE